MLTVRVGPFNDPHTRLLAADTAARITAHPVAPGLTGLVIVGAGGVSTLRVGDPTPRIIIPLPGPHPLDALARDQIGRAHAVVVRDRAEAARLASIIGDSMTLIADPGQDGARPFLQGASASQTIEAWDAVDGNPALREALGQAGRSRPDGLEVEAQRLADAAIEALVACLEDHGAPWTAPSRG